MDLVQSVESFNEVWFVRLVKRGLILELRLCCSLWSVDLVCWGVCAGVLGKGPAVLVLRHTCSSKEVPTECREAGLGISG